MKTWLPLLLAIVLGSTCAIAAEEGGSEAAAGSHVSAIKASIRHRAPHRSARHHQKHRAAAASIKPHTLPLFKLSQNTATESGQAAPQPSPAAAPAVPAAGPFAPLGFAPPKRFVEERKARNFIPLVDRWRIGFPTWDRYTAGTPGEYPYQLGHWWDPYNQNVIKGDYPIIGQHTFLDLTAVSDSLGEWRRLPTAFGVSTQNAGPGHEQFFGGGDQTVMEQFFIASFDLFHGDAGFKPVDWEFKFSPVANVNYLDVQQRGVVAIDSTEGVHRTDGHVGIQEMFAEYKLADVSPYYDVVSVRAGIQGFTSDFRGFIYSDNEPGVVLSGNYESNRDQWNLAYFSQLEKDTDSGLNTIFASRDQNVILANFTRQDFLFYGYNAQLDFAWNNDNPQRIEILDDNGFQIRPAVTGNTRPHTVNVGYFGFTGDGHIGRINVTDAFYEAYGRDSFNNIAGHPVTIDAQMGALELSYDRDYMRYKASFLYASGDANPNDRRATGFDTIFDNPDFAGSQFSFFNRQGIPLSATNLSLKGRFSLVPDLRSSKTQGQANFVNPGLLLYNLGVEAKVTPKLEMFFNVNYLQFDRTKVLEVLLHQNDIGHDVGLDYSLGLRYRPLLIDNIIFSGAFSVFTPFSGFRDIYTGQTLYSGFTALTLVY